MSRVILAALASGAIFGLGLSISGMTDPQRVLGFLDVAGDFDPTLAFVLAGAVATTAILFRFVLRRPSPLFGDRFALPARTDLDARLLVGAGLFGVGWGIAGYCPGPALAVLGAASAEAFWFVPAMLAGMVAHRLLEGPPA